MVSRYATLYKNYSNDGNRDYIIKFIEWAAMVETKMISVTINQIRAKMIVLEAITDATDHKVREVLLDIKHDLNELATDYIDE